MLCTSGFVDDVMYSHEGAESDNVIWLSSPGGSSSCQAKSVIANCNCIIAAE